MRQALRLGLVAFTIACGSDVVGPSRRVETIADSVSSVGSFVSGTRSYKVSPGYPGVLTASIRWEGDGQLWMLLFDAEPPVSREPITQTDQSRLENPATMSGIVVAGTYYVLVSQSRVILGPNQGPCRCVNNFVLTISYP